MASPWLGGTYIFTQSPTFKALTLSAGYIPSGGAQHLGGGMVEVSEVFQNVLLLIFEL